MPFRTCYRTVQLPNLDYLSKIESTQTLITFEVLILRGVKSLSGNRSIGGDSSDWLNNQRNGGFDPLISILLSRFLGNSVLPLVHDFDT